jgi:enoyl-CoA hydratase/carnithine racemase
VTTVTTPPRQRAAERVGDVLIAVEPSVVRATIDRPARRNAINSAVIDGLEHAVAVATAAGARALVISGAGGGFCAGADLDELAELRGDQTLDRLDTFMTRLERVLVELQTAPFVSLAIVDGYAVAGGCEILLFCDIVLAAADARIGDRHLEYGLVPAAGGSVNLVRSLSPARANYLLLSGELLTGEQAAAWGLVTTAVPPEQLATVSERLIERLTSRSHDALRTAKKMINNATLIERDGALDRERQLFLRHMASADVAEGLAAFRDRRPPAFRNGG